MYPRLYFKVLIIMPFQLNSPFIKKLRWHSLLNPRSYVTISILLPIKQIVCFNRNCGSFWLRFLLVSRSIEGFEQDHFKCRKVIGSNMVKVSNLFQTQIWWLNLDLWDNKRLLDSQIKQMASLKNNTM